MRLLKYAILGLVNRNPISGYDIAKEFDKGLVNFWYATHSQIYPELHRLTNEGLVTYKIDTRGDKLEKKLYVITPDGKTELTKWLATLDDLDPTPKDVFRLKLFFLNEMDKEKVISQIDNQLQKRRDKLARLEHNMIVNQRGNDSYGKYFNEDLGDYLVLRGAIMRETNYIEWLEYCLNHLKYTLQ
jgi:DNA-binding PadR family transcriptional regulator